MKVLNKIQNTSLTEADYMNAKGMKKECMGIYPARRLMAMKIDPKFWIWVPFEKLFAGAEMGKIKNYDFIPLIRPDILQTLPGYTKPSSDFVPNAFDVAVGLMAVESGMNQLLVGPTGCGKTYGAEQLMLRLGIPVFTVPCNKDTDSYALFGQTGLKNGDTYFKKGIVTLAIENYACVILDEVTAIDPTRGLDMNPLLENRNILIDGSDSSDDLIIPNHGMTHVIGTSNTGGKQSGSRVYKNASVQDMAWRDRWETHNVYYRPIEQERDYIKKIILGINPEAYSNEFFKVRYEQLEEFLIFIIEKTRESFLDYGISVPLSSRGIKSFLLYYSRSGNLHFAFHMSIMNRAEDKDKEVLQTIFEQALASIFDTSVKCELLDLDINLLSHLSE